VPDWDASTAASTQINLTGIVQLPSLRQNATRGQRFPSTTVRRARHPILQAFLTFRLRNCSRLGFSFTPVRHIGEKR
jgi:hypothetical protein